MKNYRILLGLISFMALSFACSPKLISMDLGELPEVKRVAGVDQNFSINERTANIHDLLHIHRSINGAVISKNINDGGLMWTVGVKIVPRGQKVTYVDPKVFGIGTDAMPFNWFEGRLGVLHVQADVSQPMPFIVPLEQWAESGIKKQNMFPRHDAVRYEGSIDDGRDVKEGRIVISYTDMLNGVSALNPGILTYAATWQGLSFKAGDAVDLVVYLARIEQTYAWYLEIIGTPMTSALLKKRMQDIVDKSTFGELIELQRIPVTLQ